MDAQSIWYALAIVLVLVGLAGIILPALPGLPLMFAGMLLAAWAGGFEQVGGWTLLVLAVLTLVSVGVDFLASAAGARRVGASRLAVIGALVGTVLSLCGVALVARAFHVQVIDSEFYLRQGDAYTLLRRYGPADRALATSLRICRAAAALY